MSSRSGLLAALFLAAIVTFGPAAAPASAQEVEEIPSVESYLGRIITRDPAACFRKVDLRRPELRPQQATTPTEVRARRIMLAIDASGSMRGKLGEQTKMESARSAATDFLARIDPAVEVGLVVFGHRGSPKPDGKPASCAAGGAETVLRLGAGQGERAAAAVAQLEATGWTPLAAGIEEAGRSFTTDLAAGEQVVYVISDGIETCGGDPVAAARALKDTGTKAIVNIIGFDIPTRERAALEAVASAGGGKYFDARSRAELHRVLVERLANQHRATVSKLAAQHAMTTNQLATNHAITTTRLCTNHVVTTEGNDMNRILNIALRERRIDAELKAEVEARIGERHRQLKEAIEAYAEALTSANAERAAEIEGNLARALAAPR